MKRWLVFIGSLAVLVGGATLLPYCFPPTAFIAGASVELGFNNQVAYLWYLGTLALPVLLWTRWFPVQTAHTHPFPHPAAAGVMNRVVWAVMLFHLLLFGAVYAYKGRFVFAEALYFQTLLHRMTLGEIPYLDFSFYYGPSMLYPASWLTHVVGLEAGYALWFVATDLLGLWFLFLLLRAFLGSGRIAAAWFIFLALGLITPWTGLNVTLVRYLLPSMVFLSSTRFLRDGGTRAGLWAMAGLASALTYSAEVAALSLVVIGLLVVVWSAVSGWRALRRSGLILLTALLLAGAAFLLIDPSGRAIRSYAEIGLSYTSGAHNMPVYPNLPFLTLAAATVFAAGATVCVVAQRHAWPAASLMIVYLALGLLSQRGAFGVSEPSHIAFYGLPTIVLCLLLSTHVKSGEVLRRGLAAGVAVGLLFPMHYYHVTQVLPFFSSRLAAAATTSARASGGGATQRHAPVETTLDDIVSRVGNDRPYVMYDLDYYSFPVYRKFGLRYPMYYTMLMNARTPEGIRRVIKEVREAKAVVIARTADLAGTAPPPRSSGLREALDLVSGGHTTGSRLAEALFVNRSRLFEPFLDFVRREYRPLYEEDGIVALVPKTG